MLRIVQFEELRDLLLRVPGLIDLHEQRDSQFLVAVKEWLSLIESALERNRLPSVGRMAGLRSLVICAERGVVPTGLRFDSTKGRRALREAAASHAVQVAGEILESQIQGDQTRIDEAERLICQLVALGRRKELLAHFPADQNRSQGLRSLWGVLKADPQLAPGTDSVEALVGSADALVLLDRGIGSMPQMD